MVARIRTLAVPATIAMLGALTIALRRSVVPVRVRGESMRPTYAPGELVAALPRSGPWRRVARPRVGAVVLVELPWEHDRVAIKRLVAGPGEHHPEVRDGDGWAIVGDEPTLSTDSRHHGRVPDAAITARIVPHRRPRRP